MSALGQERTLGECLSWGEFKTLSYRRLLYCYCKRLWPSLGPLTDAASLMNSFKLQT